MSTHLIKATYNPIEFQRMKLVSILNGNLIYFKNAAVYHFIFMAFCFIFLCTFTLAWLSLGREDM